MSTCNTGRITDRLAHKLRTYSSDNKKKRNIKCITNSWWFIVIGIRAFFYFRLFVVRIIFRYAILSLFHRWDSYLFRSNCIIVAAESASHVQYRIYFLCTTSFHSISQSICLSIQFSINNLTSGNWWNKNNNKSKRFCDCSATWIIT